MNEDQKLLFVYNADSSLFNQVGDLIHKTISPKTYQCRLCGLTYSGVSMKGEWRDFIQSLPITSQFLHKDEFLKQYPDKGKATFPMVFFNKNNSLIEIISTWEINQTSSLEELKKLVKKKISKIVSQ